MNVLGDLSRLGAKRHPDRIALIMDDVGITYGELNQSVNRMAHGLLAQGVKNGDNVALLGYNSIDWVICGLAITKIGCVLVGINFRYKTDEFVYAVNNSNSSLLIYGLEFEDMVNEAIPQFNNQVKLVSMGGVSGATMSGLMENGSIAEPGVFVDPETPAAITYTSGTTGRPKGVLMSHRSILAIYLGMILEGGMIQEEITLDPLPLFHAASMNGMVGATLYMGGTVVLFGTGFDPDKILSLVEQRQISLTMWVPTQLALIVNHPSAEKYDVSSLKRIWYGSSPIAAPVLEKSRRVFSAKFYQFFGQTETGMVTILRPDDHSNRSLMTGREMVNSEMRVIDQEGQDVPVGQVGEIISSQKFHGMIGYYDKPQATADTIKDGWIYTGDLARVEEGGYITLIDRAKDMIISGAENIYPKEIETVIQKFPGVKDVAVFGIPDEIYGESVCAAIAMEDEKTASEADIIAHCASQISSYKKPKKVVFMGELPVNAMGKITKNVLREPYWSDQVKRI